MQLYTHTDATDTPPTPHRLDLLVSMPVLTPHSILTKPAVQEAVRVAQQHGDAESLAQALAGVCQLLLQLAPQAAPVGSPKGAQNALVGSPEGRRGHLQRLLRRYVRHMPMLSFVCRNLLCRWCRSCIQSAAEWDKEGNACMP